MKKTIRQLNADIVRAQKRARGAYAAGTAHQSEGPGSTVRYIGDVVIHIKYNDDDTYSGYAQILGGPYKTLKKYPFADLKAPPIGLGEGVAYDSPKAYDKMTRALASFLANDNDELAEALYVGHDGEEFEVLRWGGRSRLNE